MNESQPGSAAADPSRSDADGRGRPEVASPPNSAPLDAGTEDAALPPDQMLALLDDQQRSFEGQIASFVPAIILAWGIAWLFGFSALWLIDGLSPDFSLPLPVAVTIFVVLIGSAIVISAVLGIRSGRGIRSGSADTFRGVVYGAAWWIGSIAIVVFAQGLAHNGMSSDVGSIYYPVAFVLFAGLMYVIAGAMWHAIPALVLGIWTIIVALSAPFFGYPNHYLVLAVGGGFGFLALAVISFIYLRRLRRAVTHPSGERRG